MSRLAILLGTGNAVIAIIFGAFGAHAVQNKLNERMLEIFNTAVDYHLYHALGLIIVGLLITERPNSTLLPISVYLMLFGVFLFCGSLYALSLTGITKLGIITPFGGIAFIAAWTCIFFAFLQQQ